MLRKPPLYRRFEPGVLAPAGVSVSGDEAAVNGYRGAVHETRASFRDPVTVDDVFAHLPIYGLEDLGLVGRGEAGAFIWERNTAPGSRLPLNTNGGGLSYMHSDMYGMYALQESIRRMRGTAPAQTPDVKISIAHGVGGMFGASGTIVMSNEAP